MAEVTSETTKTKEQTISSSSFNLSKIESYYLFEHLRGWTHDTYLDFYDNGKLKDVYSTGKRIEPRSKELGLNYDGMIHLDAKLGSELYSIITKNRSNSRGTELEIILNDEREVDKIIPKAVKSFDF